eukprot:snap_masked-scaffold_3-processed-gene-8.33-mRNA-1 protein AED:1.00 eAED:1.00 QI:0/0/0/0/1/1/3/0/67
MRDQTYSMNDMPGGKLVSTNSIIKNNIFNFRSSYCIKEDYKQLSDLDFTSFTADLKVVGGAWYGILE